MPDVLKCPECDANADVTKDGTQIGNNTNAVLYTKQISQASTHTVLHIPEREYKRRERADSSTGNNIFEPKESPDMKEGKGGEKGESK
ncbi:hypothetical protein E4T44_04878 [Aureobasidium sp. EXF-8845]|nr:hypothetical protein E4T44_04878 [Aureobasidium sp. EXF-8845]KAI4852229.1 hypothetical protein E4T45_04789 [Aureobasidium sp. EXF-8846]